MVTPVSAILPLAKGGFDLATWLDQLSAKYSPEAMDLIRRSCLFTQQTCENLQTFYRVDCVDEALQGAQILANLEADQESLATVLLLSSLTYTDITLEDIAEQFGDRIAKLLDGVSKMQAIDAIGNSNTSSKRVENLREMLLSMVDDVRVVLIKLAYQTHLMRHLNKLSILERQDIAHKTMALYAPLANRLGIHELKWELEDLSFRYLEPLKYKEIANQLKLTRLARQDQLKNFIKDVSQLLDKESLKYEIKGRAKHIYSIYKKMQRKSVGYHEVWDRSATRVLVESVEACYQVLSLVHTNWEHVPAEFDDYIATPKKNGYQSIHTVLYLDSTEPVELQIRTYEMHELNEVGVAAHWAYKEGGLGRSGSEQKIAWLRQLLDWQQDLTASAELPESLQQSIVTDRVFVFTPTGDTVSLVQGSTPLDFAYNIHSDIGHRCRGAKVNGHIVPLTYQLKMGDKVEILTGKEAKPSRDWMNAQEGYLASPRARARVSSWFKKEDYEQNVLAGQSIFDRELKRLNLKSSPIETLTKNFHLNKSHDFLAALGCGDIRLNQLLGHLQTLSAAFEPVPSNAEIIEDVLTHRKPIRSTSGISVDGVGDMLTKIAACCKPLPGDPILGYVTRGQGVSIHRKECSVIVQHQTQHADHILQVSWLQQANKTYTIDFVIEALEDADLLRDITAVTSIEKVGILDLKIQRNIKRLTTLIYLTVELRDIEQLAILTAKFSQVKNVYEVKRV
jgi:GTP pyrophosphokinase